LLAEREARAHVVGRALSHHRGSRDHHHRCNLSLGDERRHRHSGRCNASAEEAHSFLSQLLGDALTVIGHAGIIPDDQLDLLACDCDTLRVPLANPDFAPFLQRARVLQPDTLFVFVPAGQAGTLARQYAERGLAKSGIKLVGPGDIVDDDDLPGTGDTFLGVVI
jgi:hypothetical protein